MSDTKKNRYCEECGDRLDPWEDTGLCGFCYKKYLDDTRPNHPDDPVQ